MSERLDRDEPATGARPLTRGRALTLAAVVLALVLAIGIAGGMVIERQMFAHRRAHAGLFGPRFGERGGPPGSRESHDMMRSRIARELGLDSAQAMKIDSIMERHRPEIDSVRAAMEVRLSTVIQATRREVDSVLTPAQREKMHARWQREDSRHFPGGAGGPGGPPPDSMRRP